MNATRLVVPSLITLSSLGLVACGGGSTETTVSGNAVKGPVNGAKVVAKKADGTVCASAETSTDGTGAFRFTTTCEGDLVIEVSGGTYKDEATGATTTLTSPLKVMVAATGAPATATITPLTTLAFSSNFGGTPISAAAYQAQAQRVAQYFGMKDVDLVRTLPKVNDAADVYGNYLNAVSKFLNGDDVSKLLNADLKAGTFQQAFNTCHAGHQGHQHHV